ncbi:MAG: L,D-transpeptidase [Rhizobiaceae bacterium]
MKTFIKAAALTVALSILPFQAFAGQRYATPPPVTISPDLSSAWTLQITPRRANKADRWRAKRPRRLKRHSQKKYRLLKPAKRLTKRKSNRVNRTGVITASVQRKNTKLRSSIPSDFKPDLRPQLVNYNGEARPGTLIVNTVERRLYLVLDGGKARRYAIGVGKPGFEWAGTHKVSRKAEWPSWRPPAEMIERERKKGRNLPEFMAGGPKNPLGARALYLGSTIYRIHGTTQRWSIGKAVSSGCIRMLNEDVMDLYDRVPVGAKVKVI